MVTPPPSPSPESTSSTGASWRSVWGQRLCWLISALSGTLEIEAETKRLKQQNEKLAESILQVKKENERLAESTLQMKKEDERLAESALQMKKEDERLAESALQMKKEDERLAELESKIDGLFSKYGISLKGVNKPDLP